MENKIKRLILVRKNDGFSRVLCPHNTDDMIFKNICDVKYGHGVVGRQHPTKIYSPRYNCLGLAILDVLSFLNSTHWVIHPTVRPITKIGVNIVFGILRAVKMIPV